MKNLEMHVPFIYKFIILRCSKNSDDQRFEKTCHFAELLMVKKISILSNVMINRNVYNHEQAFVPLGGSLSNKVRGQGNSYRQTYQADAGSQQWFVE